VQKESKIRRNSVSLQKESSSGGITQSCTQSASVCQGRGPREGLAGGAKIETFEHLENLLSQRDQKAQEEERQWLLDHQSRIPNDR
jgi:hypothetical protein